jgi:AcrR family transcriptional regulator
MSDSKALSLTMKPRKRRSQAERTAETRSRILAAVVQSIAELGFQRTTATAIAQRAGVTWGAVQHHFGGKDGMLAAVIEESFDRFAKRLEDVAPNAPTAERVSLFVERAWEHFGSPDYRSTFEILIHTLGRDDLAEGPTWQRQMLHSWDGIFRRLFADAAIERDRLLELEHYTVSVLSGLASMLMLEASGRTLPATELAWLKQTLIRELAGGESSTSPRGCASIPGGPPSEEQRK